MVQKCISEKNHLGSQFESDTKILDPDRTILCANLIADLGHSEILPGTLGIRLAVRIWVEVYRMQSEPSSVIFFSIFVYSIS